MASPARLIRYPWDNKYVWSWLTFVGLKRRDLDVVRLIGSKSNTPAGTLTSFIPRPIRVVLRIMLWLIRWARLLLVPDILFRQVLAITVIQSGYEVLKLLRILFTRLQAKFSARSNQIANLRDQLNASETYAQFREIQAKLTKMSSSRQDATHLRAYSADDMATVMRLKSVADSYRRMVLAGDTAGLRFYLRSELMRKHWGVAKTRSFKNKPLLRKTLDDYLDVVCSSLVHIAMAPVDPPSNSNARGEIRREDSQDINSPSNTAVSYDDSILYAKAQSPSSASHSNSVESVMESSHEKLAFFTETRHAFGRSALLLSGGATLGLIHVGVVKALMSQQLLPRVISGSSAGSIVAGMLGCLTDAEVAEKLFENPSTLNLHFFDWFDPKKKKSPGSDDGSQGGAAGNGLHNDLEPEAEEEEDMFGLSLFKSVVLLLPSPLSDILIASTRLVPRWMADKTLLDSEVLATAVRDVTGNMTFREAYDHTGRIINITVTPKSSQRHFPLLLNYLTTPHVLVWSASVASSAIPGVFAPVELMSKDRHGNIVPFFPEGLKWVDGCIENDLPMQRLSELFNVNHFIVSQVNPHARILSPPLENDSDVMEWRVLRGTGRMLGFLRDQVKSYVKHITSFNLQSSLLKTLGAGLVPVITQKYHGDITIAPDFSVTDLMTILDNPSPEEFQAKILQGERNTWPVLSVIRMHCMIELMLDDCVHSVQKRLNMLERKVSAARMIATNNRRIMRSASNASNASTASGLSDVGADVVVREVGHIDEAGLHPATDVVGEGAEVPTAVVVDDDVVVGGVTPLSAIALSRITQGHATSPPPPARRTLSSGSNNSSGSNGSGRGGRRNRPTPPLIPMSRITSFLTPGLDPGVRPSDVNLADGGRRSMARVLGEGKGYAAATGASASASAGAGGGSGVESRIDALKQQSAGVRLSKDRQRRDSFVEEEEAQDRLLQRQHDDLKLRLKNRTQSIVGLSRLQRLGSTDRLPRLSEDDMDF